MTWYDDAIKEVFQPCIRVLTHYSCPDNCGECCKADITFDQSDLKNMINKYKDKKKEIRKSIEIDMEVYYDGKHMNLYKFKNNDPCSMLKNLKCSIYKARPLVCQIYPFTVGKAPTKEYIAIDSCPLGMQIMRDITVFVIHIAARTNQMTEEKKARYVEEMIYKLYDVSKSSLDFNHHSICKNMYVPIEWLIPFCEYLDAADDMFLEARRQFLRSVLEEEHNLSVMW